MVVIAKMSNIHAYCTPNGNSHNIALRTLAVSAFDLQHYTQTSHNAIYRIYAICCSLYTDIEYCVLRGK